MTRFAPFLILLGSALVSGYLLFSGTIRPQGESGGKAAVAGDPKAPSGSQEKFDYLANQHTNTCGIQRAVVSGYADNYRVQGSCCSKMDLTSYQKQVKEIAEKYADFSFIPKDPYDISVREARVLWGFLDNIKLTSDQQAIYNQAMKMSKEGGPCCCRCWHWDAYEGLAKKMIASYGWDAKQIAELWDLSDACGGA